MKYRKKPVIVEARQYTRIGLDAERVAEWCGGEQTNDGCEVQTQHGTALARYGDWIIKGVNGEFYPCRPDVFRETYEPVE